MEGKSFAACKNLLLVLIFLQLILTIILGLLVFSLIDKVTAVGSRYSVVFEGSEELIGGDAQSIEVPYTFSLSDDDWSLLTVVRLDELDAANNTDHSILTYKDSEYENSANILVHVNQFGGVPFTDDYLASFFEGNDECLFVGGISPEVEAAHDCFDLSDYEEYSEETSFTLEENTWYWLGVTHDASTDQITYYVNGEMVDQFTYDIPSTGSEGYVVIGTFHNLAIQWLEGLVAEYRQYSEVVTPAEMSNWYETYQRPDKQLEVEYLFQDMSDGNVKDTSGNPRSSTVGNFINVSETTPLPYFVSPSTDNSKRSRTIVPVELPPITLEFADLEEDSVMPGQVLNLSWMYNRGIKRVNLYYSTDEGSTWTKIADKISSDLVNYPWAIPGDIGTESIMFKVAGNDLAVDFIKDESKVYSISTDNSTETNSVSEEDENSDYHYPDDISADSPEAISPVTGELQPVNKVKAGTLIKGESFDAIYLVDDKLERRPIFSKAILDSNDLIEAEVKTVTDATLDVMPLGKPVLPKPGSEILSFDTVKGIFISETDDLYSEDVLRPIPKTAIIEDLIGPSDNLSELELPVTFFNFYEIGLELTPEELETALIKILN